MTSVLISSETIATEIHGAVAHRILYHSYDMHGNATQSTGLVIAPTNPGSNRRVLSWAHGTTGLGDAACPSAQPDPARELSLYADSGSLSQIDYGVPNLQRCIDEDWVVCATDYQGLGTPEAHQYMINRTNAIDTVTIVQAAREMNLGAGTQFGIVGWSQGGGAASAAAELEPVEYADLTLVGIAAMSPGIPMVAVTMPKLGRTLGPDDVHQFMNFAGLATAFPDVLKLEDVYSPLGIAIHEENWNIQSVHHYQDVLTRVFTRQGPVLSFNREKFPLWIEAMTTASAARRKPVCPVLVTIDSQDDGNVVSVGLQMGFVDALRGLGGDVSILTYPNDDHYSLPRSSMPDCLDWLTEKFQ